MDLKITTGSARAELAQIVSAIDTLQAKLTALASNTALGSISGKLASVQGLNPSVAASIQNVVAALNTAAAQSSADAAQINANLARMSNQLLYTNTTLTQFGNRLTQVGNNMQQAGVSVAGMHSGISRLNGVLGLIGISLTAVNFANFIKDSMDALTAVEKLDVQMKNLGGPKLAAAQMDFLQATARETGTSLKALVSSYGQFAQSAAYAGLSSQDTATIFKQVSQAFRVFGLSSQDATGGFKAFEQMLSKGKIQMEELRGQLADRGVPAVELLKKALGGVSSQKLEEMAKNGLLGVSAIKLLAAKMEEVTKSGIGEALNTWSAASARFESAMFSLQANFGANFFAGLRSGFASLTVALDDVNFQGLMAKIATLAGWIGSALSSAFAIFLTTLGYISPALDVIGLALAAIGSYLQPVVTWVRAASADFIKWATDIGALDVALKSLSIVLSVALTSFLLWAGVSAIMISIRLAIAALAFVTSGAALQMALFAAQAIAVIAALTALAAGAAYLTDYLGLTTGAFDRFTTQLSNVKQTVDEAIKKLPDWTDGIGGASSAAKEAAKSHNLLAKGVSGVESAAAAALPVWGASTQAVSAYKSEMSRLQSEWDRETAAATAGASANMAAGDSMGYAAGQAGALSGALSGASSAAGALNGRLTTSFALASSVYKSIGDWGTMGPSMLGTSGSMAKGTKGSLFGDSLFNTFADGGIVGKGSSSKASAPLSAFVNAPHYASGTVNTSLGGGMPAILHPNEAVIPLSGGRNVPVELRGSIAGDLAPVFTAIGSAISALRVSARQDADRIVGSIASLASTMSAFKTSGTTTTATPSAITDVPTLVQQTTPTKSTKTVGETGSGTDDMKKWAAALKNEIAHYGTYYGNGDIASKTNDQVGEGVGDRWGAPKGFATGSPNASRDDRGGFIAMLHPDEAVIPLPDGRRVPVELRDPPGSRGGNTSITLHMTVVTPDAKSFAQSEDQILQSMQVKLDRAARNVGRKSEVEDPTQRVKA